MAKITRIHWVEDQPCIRDARDIILETGLVQNLVDFIEENGLKGIVARKQFEEGGIMYQINVGFGGDFQYYVSMQGASRLTDAWGEIYFD